MQSRGVAFFYAMKGKKSFVLYSDLIHTVAQMPDDKAGILLKHILSYVNDEDPQTDDLIIQLTFEPIKQQLKRDLEKWDGIKSTRSESGRKGGLAKASNAKQKLANVAVNDNDNVNVSVNGNEIKKKEKRFTPPALSEVLKYMEEKHMSQEQARSQADKFINHYTSNGWKVGKNKMIDWRAAVRSNWLKDITKSNGQSSYTYDEVKWIHGDNKDKRTMNDFKVIAGTTNWVAI